jgi:CheY-like chemotaxis protein
VVDDKPANVLLLEGMLRVAGYTCGHSTTVPGSVRALHRETVYDLILLDLQRRIPGDAGAKED